MQILRIHSSVDRCLPPPPPPLPKGGGCENEGEGDEEEEEEISNFGLRRRGRVHGKEEGGAAS